MQLVVDVLPVALGACKITTSRIFEFCRVLRVHPWSDLQTPQKMFSNGQRSSSKKWTPVYMFPSCRYSRLLGFWGDRPKTNMNAFTFLDKTDQWLFPIIVGVVTDERGQGRPRLIFLTTRFVVDQTDNSGEPRLLHVSR